jgi:FdhE protein
MHLTSPDTTDPLVHRLHEIADQAPYLARISRLYSAILPLLREAGPGEVSAFMSQDAVRKKLAQGQYLLQDLDMEIDFPVVEGLFVLLAGAAQKAGENVSAAKVRTLLDEHREDLGAVLQDVLTGREKLLTNAAERLSMDGDIVRILALNALKPYLRAWGRRLAPLSTGIPWSRGTCLVCGALPVFGELQGNGQALHLRCGLCGADWEYQRLSCVHCGNDDHRSREHLFPEGRHDTKHIEACTNCKSYIKVIAAFSPTTADELPVEDLATVHLDAAARERGYRRPGEGP